jgi:hypothetical protein
MNYKGIALATILGIYTPAIIIDFAIPQPVLAATYNYPKVTFTDKDLILIKT